jgi:hypothetical protein
MPKLFTLPRQLLVFLCSAPLLFVPCSLPGQTAPVIASDPSALNLAGRALQAIAGRTALTDITIQATANYVAGSDEETGTATLVARGNAQSLITLNLSGGERQEIRNGTAGVWIGADGTAHAMATHNCFIDADWFFPALSFTALASDPTLVITLAGQQAFGDQQVYHLIILHNLPGTSPATVSLIQRASAIDIYLAAVTLLPVAVDFNIHADSDANLNIPVEIRYGAYQQMGGIWVPTRIQKYLQGSLLLDLTVTNVAVNSGVQDSAFTLPIVPEGGAQ